MNTKIIYSIGDSVEELFLFFIDDEHIKDIEIKFESYLNEYFNYNEKNDSLSGETGKNDKKSFN